MSYGEWFADWNASWQQQRAQGMELARRWVGCRVRVCYQLEGRLMRPEYGVLEQVDEEEGVMHILMGSLPGGQPAYLHLGVGFVDKGVTLAQESEAAEG